MQRGKVQIRTTNTKVAGRFSKETEQLGTLTERLHTETERLHTETEWLHTETERLGKAIAQADAIVVGAGAGLSTAAGFTYAGDRFKKYFADFEEKYDFHDMYSGGFYPYATLEEYWAYWSRYIYINRYVDAPRPVYNDLYELIRDKDYFVITTNVDHCFQKAGFDRHRLFYTQGDYGLLQCSRPCHRDTYDNEELVKKMVLSQGFEIDADGGLFVPRGKQVQMRVPTELLPVCPHCGRPMTMNLRADETFVQDAGWDQAAQRYDLFQRRHRGLRTLYMEMGVGFNTPGIVKFSFWQMAQQNPNAVYVCINKGEAYAPREIMGRSICINDDIREVLQRL